MVACGCWLASPSAVPTALGAQPQVTAKLPATSRFDQAKAWAQLLKQCSFGPRTPGTPAHIACRDYLLAEFKKHTDNARLQEFTHTWSSTDKPVTMWNVLGEQNWEKATVRVALFAHWPRICACPRA